MLSLDLKIKFTDFIKTNPDWGKRLDGLLAHYDFGYCGWNDRLVPKDMRHRILFPVNNPDGSMMGLCGRSADGRVPKYKHPHGYKKGQALYNIGKCNYDKPVVLVEGNIDAMRCTVEFQQAVALEGINMTHQQETLLCRFKKVIIGLDHDDAGLMASIIIASRIMKKVDLYIAVWDTQYKDIDELYLDGKMVKKIIAVQPDTLIDIWAQLKDPKKQPFYNNTTDALISACGSRLLMESGVIIPPRNNTPRLKNLNFGYHGD